MSTFSFSQKQSPDPGLAELKGPKNSEVTGRAALDPGAVSLGSTWGVEIGFLKSLKGLGRVLLTFQRVKRKFCVIDLSSRVAGGPSAGKIRGRRQPRLVLKTLR